MSSEGNQKSKVKIVYKPAKEVVILDYFQFSKNTLDQMFARLIHTGLPVMAQWAEGVVFVHFPLTPETNDLMENYLEGRIFWSSINFALMPNYALSIKVSGLEIPILDVSDHPILHDIAKWLREHAKPESELRRT